MIFLSLHFSPPTILPLPPTSTARNNNYYDQLVKLEKWSSCSSPAGSSNNIERILSHLEKNLEECEKQINYWTKQSNACEKELQSAEEALIMKEHINTSPAGGGGGEGINSSVPITPSRNNTNGDRSSGKKRQMLGVSGKSRSEKRIRYEKGGKSEEVRVHVFDDADDNADDNNIDDDIDEDIDDDIDDVDEEIWDKRIFNI